MKKALKISLPIIFIIFFCNMIFFPPFFTFKRFPADQSIKHPDLSVYGINKNYKIQFNSTLALADVQATNHFCVAANNLGLDCQIAYFDHTAFLELKRKIFFLMNELVCKLTKPDLVIYMLPHFRKSQYLKPSCKTYCMTISATLNKIRKYDFDYDGYLIFGEDHSWLDGIIDSKKIISGNYIGAPAIEFVPRSRNYLVYTGSNWDKKRGSKHYREIFKLLDQTNYFYAYGEKGSWRFLKNSYYGYDDSPHGLIEKLNKAGISLILHSAYHWKTNEPSAARVFEAAAAGNVIISDNLPIIMKMFGDSIFYIDPTQEPKKVAEQIDSIVKWVKNNPDEANAIAKKSHDIFVNNYSSEKTIINILKKIKP